MQPILACAAKKISFRSLFREDAEVAFEFDRRKAMDFLAIAKNQVLTGGGHVHHLPNDYHTLAKLAQIPAPKLKLLPLGGLLLADAEVG